MVLKSRNHLGHTLRPYVYRSVECAVTIHDVCRAAVGNPANVRRNFCSVELALGLHASKLVAGEVFKSVCRSNMDDLRG